MNARSKGKMVKRPVVVSGAGALVLGLLGAAPAGAQLCEVPLLVSGGAKPNVLVAYDTSASMRELADPRASYDLPGVDDLYQGNYVLGPDYRAQFEAQLATLDPAADPIAKHMLDLHGSATAGFDRLAIYDAAENKVCDSWNSAPCSTNLSEAAKCNLGKAVTNPIACAENLTQGGNQRKTPSDVVTNAAGPFAFGKGWAMADWNDSKGRAMPSINANPPQLANNGFWSGEALYQGHFLNYLHARVTRDTVARKALVDLVDFTKNQINWCLMNFTPRLTGSNPGAGNLGGVVVSECDGSDSLASAAGVRDAIFNYSGAMTLSSNMRNPVSWSEDGLIINAFGDTPIARQLHDAYRYLRGQLVPPGGGAALPSPVDYSCQDNFTIVMTDGRPTGGDYDEGDIDGISIEGHSCGASSFNDNDDSDAADDLSACIAEYGDLSTLPGRQEMVTYTIGFADDSGAATNVLSDMAANGGGEFIFASSTDELRQAFARTAQSILNRTASATSAAVVSTSGTTGDLLVSAFFQSESWQGNLKGFQLPLTDPVTELWNAGDQLEARAPGDRLVYTVIDSDGDGRINDLVQLTQANAAQLEPYLGVASTGEAQDVIDWTIGHKLPGYRERDPDQNGRAWKLGDIIHSDPVIVGEPPYFYGDLDYRAFYEANKDRDKIVYVAANDGGLHAFDAATGRERWMLVPNFNLPRLEELADPYYCHQFVMDGSPSVADAYVRVVDGGPNQWRTVLMVGSGHAGGYIALDITDPGTAGSPTLPTVMWQFPNPVDFDPTVSAPDVLEEDLLGWASAKPQIAFEYRDGTRTFPTNAGRWRAYFGSGPQNSDGKAYLYGVSLNRGNRSLREKLDDDGSNWPTHPTPVDLDSDSITDRIYVATRAGKLYRYRFDVASDQKQLVFDTGGLPISARPVISFLSDVPGDPDTLAIFGTGKLDDEADKLDTTLQRLFAIKDPGNSNTANPTTDPMVELADLVDMTDPDPTISDFTNSGWYMDLKLDANAQPGSANPATGFRVLEEPVLINGNLFQVLFDPTEDPCEFGGRGALLALDLFTGNAPAVPIMDVDGDGDVDGDDLIDGEVPRGKDLGAGMPSKPVVDNKRKMLIIQSSDTSLDTTAIRTEGAPVDVRVWKVLGR